MRAIIIEDKDARALLERLELEKMRQMERLSEDVGMPFAIQLHAQFRLIVSSWLHEQGCDLMR